MTAIRHLMARDFSRPVPATISVADRDPAAVFSELGEYVVTDRIRADYERAFAAMAAALTSPEANTGIWISGFFGAGKSSFAKNIASVLANPVINGTPASALFLEKVPSKKLAESVALLNRSARCDVFSLNAYRELPKHAAPEHLAAAMYRVLLTGLGHPVPARRPAFPELVSDAFDLYAAHRAAQSFAFILEMDETPWPAAEQLQVLSTVVDAFSAESRRRMKAGTIPAPAWIIVTAQQPPPRPFPLQIGLSPADLREIVACRILRKKPDQEFVLRDLFAAHGESLLTSVQLEGSSRRTDFSEDDFVRCYPYLPHLIDFSVDVADAIQRLPDALTRPAGNRTVVKQCFELLASGQIGFRHRLAGALVSVDRIYDLVEANLPPERRAEIDDIRRRFDSDDERPGMAGRVAKALCMMELADTDLQRTAKNIAALLVHEVSERPQLAAVEDTLYRFSQARCIRQTSRGWKLFEFDELRRTVAALEPLRRKVGQLNPRRPGWHNDRIQQAKTLVARTLEWYSRSLAEFTGALCGALEQVTVALDRLSTKLAALERRVVNPPEEQLSMDVIALEGRLALIEQQNARQVQSLERQLESLRVQLKAGAPAVVEEVPAIESYCRTTYIVGLFGTGRRYLNQLLLLHTGDRARYFRDSIRVHPGPTPMIYSGHATIRYLSRDQAPPQVMRSIHDAVAARFADLIFIYRHPLDSLLTNWVWWRTYLRDNRTIAGIRDVYPATADLCADLDAHFDDFRSFAAGDPSFFAGFPGPRFLSFPEFVEETGLHIQSAPLALRLEDFIADPVRQFSRVLNVMSLELDPAVTALSPPGTRLYTHRLVKEQLPRFSKFIDDLDPETKARIDRFGYTLT